MTAPQETLATLEEQLALEDSQLAIMGIARSMALTEKEITDAERSITFNQNYRPTPPGPRPHPEAGGMDHEDWNVASLEYANADDDSEQAINYAENSLARAEDKLRDLLDDKELVEGGDETVTAMYAGRELERIKTEIEKQHRAQQSAERHQTYLKGAEIEGATSLRTAIEELATDSKLGNVRGKVSTSGWKFVGTPRHGSRLMFVRTAPEAAKEQEIFHWKFNETELLTVGASDEGVSLEYTQASDIDEDAIRRYDNNLATVDAYKFNIKKDGYVTEQSHMKGKKDRHLPNHMDNGTINGGARYGANDPTTPLDAVINSDDIARMRAKVVEVAEAMKELGAQSE